MAQVNTAFRINAIRHISLELFVYGASTRAAIFFSPSEGDACINPFPVNYSQDAA